MEPTESGETFWMFLSLLSLPVEKQIEILGGLPTKDDPLVTDYSQNPASNLLAVLYEYYSGWLDEFFPNCPNAEALYLAVNGGKEFKFSQDNFIHDDEWEELRTLAKRALKESGLEPFPVPDRIDFDRYIEIVSTQNE